MLELTGEYIKTVEMKTKKEKKYNVHQFLVNGGKFQQIVNVKDFTNMPFDFQAGNVEKIPVWVSAWATKDGRAGLDYLREKE